MELCNESVLKVIIPVILILVQIPFFIAFEMKKPKPRDLMPIAVLSVIGALGRAVFAVIPSFNPNSAVVIIAGMQFGPLAGFLTGSLSALASNMLLGQGPWTLWQMAAWGMMGCFAGVFQRMGVFKYRAILYSYGFLSCILFGWFMNLQYLIGYINPLTWVAITGAIVAALPFDLTHGISTLIFLFLLEKPWGKKLNRLKIKYGILETRRE